MWILMQDMNYLSYTVLCIHKILEEKLEFNEAVHHLFIDFMKAYDSDWREVLYNILIEFGIPMHLVRKIKMCLNETYCTDWVGRHLSDMFPINTFRPRRVYILRGLSSHQSGAL
jgi:hypothetical protein